MPNAEVDLRSEKVEFSEKSPAGWFKFSCGAGAISDIIQLRFYLSGPDRDYFQFSQDLVWISPVVPYQEVQEKAFLKID